MSIVIYNIIGQEIDRIIDEVKNAGIHAAEWNASHLPSGVYFYKIQASNFEKTFKMLYLK